MGTGTSASVSAADILVPVQAEQRLQLSVLPLVQFPVGNVVIWQELRLLR